MIDDGKAQDRENKRVDENPVRASVKLIECPRDAWQGLVRQVPTEEKTAYLQGLLDAGFRHVDAVSFVSPAAVPQMADSEAVLAGLRIPADAEVIGIVVNERGAERALATGRVTTLGYPHSISTQFLERNQRVTPETSLAQLRRIVSMGAASGMKTVAYLSMAFGNPYGEPWTLDAVVEACRQIADAGVTELSLADTVGAASSAQVGEMVSAVRGMMPETGVHLHARRESASALIRSAWDAGCRRFDAALGGLGGCPFAQDDLVGNMATEAVYETLRRVASMEPALTAAKLSELVERSVRIAAADDASASHGFAKEGS